MQVIQSFLEKSVAVNSKIFSVWRALFGVYFTYYAFRMLPYATEVYSRNGMVPEASQNWTYGLFPNILYFFDSPTSILVIHLTLIIAGVLLAFGYFPRVAALTLWYLQTALYNRNVLTDDPSMAFVGLLFITLALIPYQESIFSKEKKKELHIPYFAFFIPILIFCITFTASAVDKLMSVSWWNGSALYHMLQLGITRDTFLVYFFIVHQGLTKVLSYAAVLVQLICLPLFIAGRYRVALVLNFLAFCFIFLILDLNQVIYGMLFFYSFFLLPDVPEMCAHIKVLYKNLARK